MPSYVPRVEPAVPNAQENKSPQIILEGFRSGMAAATQLASMRRETERDMARLALQERIASDGHDLDQQKLNMAAEMLPAQKALAQAHAQYYRDGASNRLNQAGRDLLFNQQKESLVNDVNMQADKLRLTDPRFPTDDPVGYAASALKFRDMYEHSPEPWLKHAVGQYMRTADQQKISIRRTARDSSGLWKSNEAAVQVPVWQVVRKLQNPATKEEATEELRAAGHIGTESRQVNKPATHGFKKFLNDTFGANWEQPQTETTETKSPQAIDILNKAPTTDFSRAPSRVPPAMLPSSARRGTYPTDMPTPYDETPVETESEEEAEYPDQSAAGSIDGDYEATDTDKIVGQALRALRLGADPKALAARLEERGIDPRLLWA